MVLFLKFMHICSLADLTQNSLAFTFNIHGFNEGTTK